MKFNKMLLVPALILIVGLSACSDSSDDASKPESNVKSSETNKNQSEDTSTENIDSKKEDNQGQANAEDKKESTDTTNKTEESESVQEDQTSKVEGRKSEFLGKLDTIQKEVDAMSEKAASDKGVTNAMKSYYGIAYERYDQALNEIYALLKKELSPETMNDLDAEQLKWIDQKEEQAEEERLEHSGTTFENVAMYISLYESTKTKCYELVNNYMAD